MDHTLVYDHLLAGKDRGACEHLLCVSDTGVALFASNGGLQLRAVWLREGEEGVENEEEGGGEEEEENGEGEDRGDAEARRLLRVIKRLP